MFVLAQISGFLAWIALLISYYRKNTNKILVFHILSIIFYLLNYLFLGAWSGLIIIILELLRDFLYYKTDKDNLIFIITIPFYVILFLLVKDNFVEIIPIAASLLEGFTLTKKKNIVVPGALIVYSMWIVYDISVSAYTGALTDALIVLSNIGILINLFKGYKKSTEFKTTSRFSITENELKKMYFLKKDLFAKELLLSDSYEEKLYEKSKENFLFIKHKNILKGYITTINISKETLNKILEIKTIQGEYENIIINSNNYGKSLIIDSIVLKEKYQNNKTIDLIIKSINKLTRKKNNNNVLIIASTDFEKEIALKLKYIEIKKLEDNSIIYSKKGI